MNQILSGEATETVVENIHEYLSTMGERIRKGKIGLEEFIIFKVRSFRSFVVCISHCRFSVLVKIQRIILMQRASLMSLSLFG